jgi:hypothetical protein
MHQRPRLLTVISFSFLLLSATPLLRFYHHFGNDVFDIEALTQGLSIKDWALVWLGLGGALLARNASRILAAGLPLLTILAGLELLFDSRAKTNLLEASPSLWSAGLFLTMQFLWIIPSARRALMSPKTHWWKTPRRVPLNASANVRTGFGKNFLSKVSNISRTGLLLDTSADFHPGQFLEVRFLLGPLCVIHCRAEVVRRQLEADRGKYGLRILEMRTNSRVQMERYLNREMSA